MILVWLVFGAASAMFSVGAAPQIWAPWAAAFFTLRFVRHTHAHIGLPLTLLAWAVAHAIGWRGVLPFQGWIALAVPAAFGVYYVVPFVIDRLLSPRLPVALAWMVFPCAWTSAELAFQWLGFGSWGAVAYSQFGATSLLQALSIFGLPVIAFLIGWFASCTNAALDKESGGKPLLVAYIVVVGVVLLGGSIRVSTAPPSDTVRIAGIVVDNMTVFRETWAPLSYGEPLSETAAARVRGGADQLVDELFARSAAAAADGAKIIVWSEANALIFSNGEAALIDRGRAFATEHGVMLFMSAAVMTPGARLAENVLFVIDERGRLLDRYLKSHPTPGEMSIAGNGRMGIADTAFGKIAWAICYDFDYPALIRQAGRARAGLMIDPAWEHAGMTPIHARMAALRAPENGASLFRVTNGGLSIATDGYGRTIAQQSADRTSAHSFMADVPVSGIAAAHPVLGEAFGYLTLVVLGMLAVIGRSTRRRHRTDQPT